MSIEIRRQTDMYLLIALIYCTCNWIAQSCSLQSKPLDVFHYIPSLDGMQCYGADVLFEVSGSSLLSCAADCSEADVCLGFSYDKSSKVCIGCFGSVTTFKPGAVGNNGFAVDWTPFDRHHAFRVSSLEVDFNEAVEYCKCQGAAIARIDSAEKSAFINSLSWDHDLVWMGLTDEDHEGVWTWILGGDEANYTDWKIGSTPLNEGRDCAVIGRISGYKWKDIDCSKNLRVLCEKRI